VTDGRAADDRASPGDDVGVRVNPGSYDVTDHLVGQADADILADLFDQADLDLEGQVSDQDHDKADVGTGVDLLGDQVDADAGDVDPPAQVVADHADDDLAGQVGGPEDEGDTDHGQVAAVDDDPGTDARAEVLLGALRRMQRSM